MKPTILALNASPRNGRWGSGLDLLIESIKACKDLQELKQFLQQEGSIRYSQYLESGREQGLSFDETYKNLKNRSGKKGLCNSEIGMAAALWGAHSIGCSISAIALSSYFKPNGESKDLDELKQLCLQADGFLFCTPVYFGDRSSIGNNFIEFIRSDADLRKHLKGKAMGGVTVGAKRNGGQETSLIYQILDLTNLGMLGVGNDSETTSQYGGTLHAGDIGTAVDDEYGINTSLGTGRRIGRVARLMDTTGSESLKGNLNVLFWILQDYNERAESLVKEQLVEPLDNVNADILQITNGEIHRCIACDICPTTIGPDFDYRCVIKRKSDFLKLNHAHLIDYDLIVPVAYSRKDRSGMLTNYQKFIERTRYLRRGDYLFSDTPLMPLVIEEIESGENLHIRMITSLIRHHTIILKPNICYEVNDKLINLDSVKSSWIEAINTATKITVGRLKRSSREPAIAYKPVGFVLSSAKDNEESVRKRHEILQEDRIKRRQQAAKDRLIS